VIEYHLRTKKRAN